MFDIGFWELILIGVIALLVVGPERLPAMARNVGLWVGRIRKYVSHVKDDIEREIRAEELREMMKESSQIEDLDKELSETRDTLKAVEHDIEEADASLSRGHAPVEDEPASPVDSAARGLGEKISSRDSHSKDGEDSGKAESDEGSEVDERRSGQ